jgi:hypothetical protein
MLERRRRWARLLVLPALWSAVVAMAPAPIHACGGGGHGSAPAPVGAAADAAPSPDGVDAHHHPEAADAGAPATDGAHGSTPGHRDCECVGCGAPAAATTAPAFRLELAAPGQVADAPRWPAAARARVSRSAHALPFSIGPPQG